MAYEHNSYLLKHTVVRRDTKGKIKDIDYQLERVSIISKATQFPLTPEKGEIVVIGNTIYKYSNDGSGNYEWVPISGGGAINQVASTVPYTPSTESNWDYPPPSNVKVALDVLSHKIKNDTISANRIIETNDKNFVTQDQISLWTDGDVLASRVIEDSTHQFITSNQKNILEDIENDDIIVDGGEVN